MRKLPMAALALGLALGSTACPMQADYGAPVSDSDSDSASDTDTDTDTEDTQS